VPVVGHELSRLLENRGWFSLRQRRHADYQVSLATGPTDVDNWLNDNRAYNKGHHGKAGESMTFDVAGVLDGRGPAVAQQTPSITIPTSQLHLTELGADPARRQHSRQLVASRRTELAASTTAIAAFDDLVVVA